MGFTSYGAYLEALASIGRAKLQRLAGEGEEPALMGERIDAMEAEFQRKTDEGVLEGVFFPLEYACEMYRLSSFERHCAVFVLLGEVDRETARRFAGLDGEENGKSGHGLLTVELACRLWRSCQPEDIGLEVSAVENLLPYFRAGGLLFRFFLTPGREGETGLSRTLRLNRRMRGFLLEKEWEDPELAGVARRIEPEDGETLDLQRDPEWESILKSMERAWENGGRTLYFLRGPAGSGKKTLVREFCRRQDIPLLMIQTEELASRGEDILPVIQAECLLYQCVPCFVGWAEGAEREEGERRDEMLERILQAAAAVSSQVFILSVRDWDPQIDTAGLRLIPVALSVPSALARLRIWEQLAEERGGRTGRGWLPVAETVDFRGPANRFPMTRGQMRAALESAGEEALFRGLEEIDQDCVETGCRRQLPDRFRSGKAVSIPCMFQWDDLILPERSRQLLRLACDQVTHAHTVYQQWGFEQRLPYGRGLSMLFCGPPGTGKTMGAQVVARELRLPLYRVNLAGVVSKYVGETERNLQEIFEDAEQSPVVLFFDEADVLFGKRTEIKGANDKYSNMEAAFLLQKIEEYEGVSILATNYLQNFDEAFKRRIKFVVDFPFPDTAHRLLLWQKAFPQRTPVEADVDREYLASRFELSGSNIKNIAVNAAFEAASSGEGVSMARILRALKNELIKSGKSISAEEWGQYYVLAERDTV